MTFGGGFQRMSTDDNSTNNINNNDDNDDNAVTIEKKPTTPNAQVVVYEARKCDEHIIDSFN